jgi:hypothetical protein
VCNAIYQNRLALDYLPASEGGVCGKFNVSNCCLLIDDEGKVIEKRMRKISHVPIRLGKDGVPTTCLEVGSLPWVGSRP